MIRIMFYIGVGKMGMHDDSPPELLRFDPVLLATTKELHYPAGQVLFRAGERPRSVFFILRGQALLQRLTVEGACVIAKDESWFSGRSKPDQFHLPLRSAVQKRMPDLVFPISALRDAIDRHWPTRWAMDQIAKYSVKAATSPHRATGA